MYSDTFKPGKIAIPLRFHIAAPRGLQAFRVRRVGFCIEILISYFISYFREDFKK